MQSLMQKVSRQYLENTLKSRLWTDIGPPVTEVGSFVCPDITNGSLVWCGWCRALNAIHWMSFTECPTLNTLH